MNQVTKSQHLESHRTDPPIVISYPAHQNYHQSKTTKRIRVIPSTADILLQSMHERLDCLRPCIVLRRSIPSRLIPPAHIDCRADILQSKRHSSSVGRITKGL